MREKEREIKYLKHHTLSIGYEEFSPSFRYGQMSKSADNLDEEEIQFQPQRASFIETHARYVKTTFIDMKNHRTENSRVQPTHRLAAMHAHDMSYLIRTQ